MNHSQSERDRHFMTQALREAGTALTAGEIPVGCVVVMADRIIASARNSRRSSHSKIAHAELNAIRKAEDFLYENQGRCEIYVTLEPCMMCLGAIICSRFQRVVFGARDYQAGVTMLSAFDRHYSAFSPKVIGGVRADESIGLLKRYVARNQPHNDWAGRYFGIMSGRHS